MPANKSGTLTTVIISRRPTVRIWMDVTIVKKGFPKNKWIDSRIASKTFTSFDMRAGNV